MTTKALLLNMRDFTIVKEFESVEAATEAQELPEFAGFPKHIVERDNWDLTAVDLVKFFNRLTAANPPVKRFSDRPTGMKRILAALNGEIVAPVKDPEPETAAVKPKPKTAKKTDKPGAGRAPTHADTALLKPTKVGEQRRWQQDSNRYKLFAHIQKKGELTIGALVKYGEGELKMKLGEIRAALQKMTGDACVSVKG